MCLPHFHGFSDLLVNRRTATKNLFVLFIITKQTTTQSSFKYFTESFDITRKASLCPLWLSRVPEAFLAHGHLYFSWYQSSRLNLIVVQVTVASEDVCWRIRNVNFINERFYNMRCLVMFIAAVCLLFLPKLKWPKNKRFYGLISAVESLRTDSNFQVLQNSNYDQISRKFRIGTQSRF